MNYLGTIHKKSAIEELMVPRNDRVVKTTSWKIPVIVALIFVATPMLWFGQLYLVAGDYSQLYYLMPRAMMNDYLFNILSDNSLGSLGATEQQSCQARFYIVYKA